MRPPSLGLISILRDTTLDDHGQNMGELREYVLLPVVPLL